MKTSFKNSIILLHKPNPEVNQIWEDKQGRLIRIYHKNIYDNVYHCEYENGHKFGMSLSWFDGETYKYIGIINL